MMNNQANCRFSSSVGSGRASITLSHDFACAITGQFGVTTLRSFQLPGPICSAYILYIHLHGPSKSSPIFCSVSVSLFVEQQFVPVRKFGDIRRVVFLALSKVRILAGVKFLLYATERVAPDYFTGSFCLGPVEAGLSFWLSTSLVNVLNNIGLSRIVEEIL